MAKGAFTKENTITHGNLLLKKLLVFHNTEDYNTKWNIVEIIEVSVADRENHLKRWTVTE